MGRGFILIFTILYTFIIIIIVIITDVIIKLLNLDASRRHVNIVHKFSLNIRLAWYFFKIIPDIFSENRVALGKHTYTILTPLNPTFI